MSVPKPMLAAPLKRGRITNWNDWAIEEKFDGHRRIIVVGALGDVTAYSRPGKTKPMIEQPLPEHLEVALRQLPAGIYDGEDLAGDTATDVKRTDLAHERRIVLFDVLSLAGQSCQSCTYDQRRELLGKAVARVKTRGVRCSASTVLTRQRDVEAFVNAIWKTGGEGAILKRRASIYHAGKRTEDWLKVKRVEHFTLTLVGWQPSRGTVRFPGHPFAIVVLRDAEGNETTCKTKDDEELAAFEKGGFLPAVKGTHPALGRKLVIECGGRTRDGGYKGPVIWDRWEDE
jgi:bifunctional non-homologous end joining protein LigD